MSTIEALLRRYQEVVSWPWDRTLAGPQKVWFIHYEAEQERRLRLRLPDFEAATKNAGHGWVGVDLTDSFARWMTTHDYRDEYFEHPEDMAPALEEFGEHVAAEVRAALASPETGDNAVVAVHGVLSLFGLMRTSALVEAVAPSILGRLLVFFPGEREGNNFRFLGVRDGWNYQALSITAEGE